MSLWIVFLVYGAAVALAVWLDYRLPRVHWYWRAIAVALAFAAGLTPPLPSWTGPGFDLTVGAIFLFLFVWGVSEVFFRLFHVPHHRQHVPAHK